MAPIKQVRTLYDISLDRALEVIHGHIYFCSTSLATFRTKIIGMLHGGIRDHLIERAVKNYSLTVFDPLDMLELLADSTTKKLQLKKNGEFLTNFQIFQLFTSLDSFNITGLYELHAKISTDDNSTDMLKTNILAAYNCLHKAIGRGLASTLRVLTLHNVADNSLLKLIGQHAEHLTSLDITCSWLVDDIGIGDLLLKCNKLPDLQQVLRGLLGEEPELAAIEALGAVSKSQMNKVCETLQEVRIQDTNTSSISLILLLLFCTNLKSLGGFLYYRNIGDAVLSVQSRKGAPPYLALSELWDMQLPHEKLVKISKYLPNLHSLYTRANWLPIEQDVLPPLTNLMADFDFVNYMSILFLYLSHSGASIRRLTLIDQIYSIDISKIGILCPNLEELTAKVNIEDVSTNFTLQNLHSAKLRIINSSTFQWIIDHAPNLQNFEILLEWVDNEDFFAIDNDIILQLTTKNPPSLQSLKYFSIHMSYNMSLTSSMLQWDDLTIEAAYAIISACNNLKVLGELNTWFKVSTDDIITLANTIKKNNWDVKVSVNGKLYPP